MTPQDATVLDRPERLVAVSQVSRLLDQPSESFDRIAESAAAVAGAPVAFVTLIDGNRQRFLGSVGAEIESTSRAVAFCNQVISTGSDYIVPNALEDPETSNNPLVIGSFGLRSYAGTLIRLGDQALGAVCVIDRRPRDFGDQCMKLLASLAATAEAVISERLTVLDRPAPKPPNSVCLHEQVLAVSGQAVVVTDMDDRVMWANGASQLLFESSVLIGRLIDDVQATPSRHHLSERYITERIAPLIDSETGAVTGTIRSFVDVTQRENERLRLERLVNTEWLTGVANRRAFEAQLVHELDRLAGTLSPEPLAVGILDLDSFKAVNDGLGHAAGDEVLVEVAEALNSQLGSSGTVARLGGDEFAFLISVPDRPGVDEASDLVLHAICDRMVAHDDIRRAVTASIGVTLLRQTDRTPGDVLLRADLACYEAKQAGGNCARIHE